MLFPFWSRKTSSQGRNPTTIPALASSSGREGRDAYTSAQAPCAMSGKTAK